jgi:hypothetical protein
VSLLSELIAQLHALIDQNRDTDRSIQGACDQVEAAIGQLQVTTTGSSSALVAEGLGQLRAGLEKLEETRTLLAAGNAAMEQYIAGPLLGGGAGGGGGAPPGQPPTPAPPPPGPGPELRRSSNPSETQPIAVMRPQLAPDPARRPSGPPTKIEGKETKRRSLEKENESAVTLARAGYDIEQNPPPKPNGKEPDYLVQGEYFDCYSPTGDSARTIYGQLHKKVSEGQADRIVLNLDLSGASRQDIRARMERYPIQGLKEIKIVEQGVIEQFYPWESEA